MISKDPKQFEHDELSSVLESDQNTTLYGFDNKSLLFVSDITNLKLQNPQELNEDADFASGFLSVNTSFQANTSFISQKIPKIPLDPPPKIHQEVIFEAEETNSLQTQQTISSLNVQNNHCLKFININSDDQKDDLYLTDFNLKWVDILGVNEQKQIIFTMIMMPLKLPSFFKKIPPTNTLLIYGPQNCGKASIVKCIANEFKEIKVIYVKCSQLLNKRNGEEYIQQQIIDKQNNLLFHYNIYKSNPKKVFKEVQKYKKVLIFLENIDDLFGYSDIVPDKDYDMMIQSQQCAQYIQVTLQELQKQRGVFIYASSQCPWKLNIKIQKFFQKSVSIKWPTKKTKISLIKRMLKQQQIQPLSDESIKYIADNTKRYSCKEIEKMVQFLTQSCVQQSKLNIKIIQNEQVQGFSLFNSTQPKEEHFLEYIKNYESELKNYDKYSFENYEALKNEMLKSKMQKREEMLKL